jgi:hypothetical protein
LQVPDEEHWPSAIKMDFLTSNTWSIRLLMMGDLKILGRLPDVF